MAFELNKQALKGYLKLACEYGKNYTKIRPPLVHHLQRNRPLRTLLEQPGGPCNCKLTKSENFKMSRLYQTIV